MFWHNFKYNLINTIRQKDLIFWMMLFPILLGTFFYMAFGNLYEEDELFSEIPVAVVGAESDETFRSVMDELSAGDNALFNPEYTDDETARRLLEDGDVHSIVYVGEELTMSVNGTGLMPSIIKSFLEQYETQKTIITDTAMRNPEKLEAVIAALSEEINCVDTKELSGGNMDAYAQYFHNLIAMVALFGTTSGLMAAIDNQGNLSAIGARKCISPTHKLVSIITALLASFVAQTFCTALSTTYLVFVLKVDMGDNIPLLYLSGAIGSLAGVSIGFFIGSIGRMTMQVKNGIAMAGTMFLCFMSGLMVGNMKSVVEVNAPWFNRINPAALISDLFYCLSIYDDYTRYIQTAGTLLIISVIFTAGGFLLTRRKKYASI
ncbi:MAG: ABC transporter permease [Ruminococcus sp.]|nr:ABC transporter permease [Ruminococcus sp.]